jgi:S1-C subfamily serine protease
MFQEDDNFYSPYQDIIAEQDIPQTAASGMVGLLDRPTTPLKQDAAQPSYTPSAPPSTPTPSHRQHGSRGTFMVLALALLIVFGIGLFAGWEFAGGKSGNATPTTTVPSVSSGSSNALQTQQEIAIAKVEPAVVRLNVMTVQGEQVGSGVIINANGDIVTNNHVVSGAQTIEAVLSNGKTVPAQLVGTDAAYDLAVVHITPYANMVVAQIGNSSQLVVGQEVIAIGNPLGITETATTGIVSALNQRITESAGITIPDAIQTDAAINPGNSGGALINLQGQLIGIPTMGAIDTEFNTPANGISFAIPSNIVVTAVQQILQ